MNKIFSIIAVMLIATMVVNAQRTVGLLSYKPWKSYDGYNLFYPHNQSSTFLIDNCGEIVHVWSGEEDRRPGNTAYLQENGDLVRLSRSSNISQDPIWAGGGGETIEIRSWDNQEIWSYSLNTAAERLHHDVAILPDGHILAIVWELKTIDEAIAAGRDTSTLSDGEMWPDKIIEIDPITNEIVWEWHAWDHLVQDFDDTKANYGDVSQSQQRININWDTSDGSADWMHSNALDYDPFNEQILLSVPTFNEVWVIDHTTTTEQAAGSTGGFAGRGGDLLYRWGNPSAYNQGTEEDQKLFYQHDVHIVDDFLLPSHPLYGKFAAFNNRVGEDFSSVVIWDNPYDMYKGRFEMNGDIFAPEDFAISLTHPIPQKLFSTGLSSIQVLPNSNYLICDGRHGYSFEMTPDNDIVWEYVTPLKGGFPVMQGDSLEINNNLTFRMTRYPIDFAAFVGKDLAGDGFIEIGSEEEFCDQILPTEMSYVNDDLNIYPVPASNMVTIEWETKQYEEISIIDALGRLIYSDSHSGGRLYLDISAYDAGYYFVKTSGAGIKKFLIVR